MIGDHARSQPIVPPLIYQGMHVVVNRALGEYTWLRRTWRERLFSKPWRPWVSGRSVELGCRIRLLDGVIYASPRAFWLLSHEARLRAASGRDLP